MPRWLAVEGIVGAGKTTTAVLAAEQLGIPSILERPDEHPLLGAYHESPERYALETELIFMAMHRHCVREAGGVEDMLSDFSPAKDLIFAALTLGGDDMDVLQLVDGRLWPGAESPSVAVFLDVPIAECLRRAKERGRWYEVDLSEPYLERLRERYMKDLSILAKRVIKIDLDGDEQPSEVATIFCDAVGGI
jgi:deoxyadenosine/deoxycytidine kinase